MGEEEMTFLVTGEFLTEIARQMAIDEKNVSKALEILEAAFPDMSKLDQVGVVIGLKKLVGDSTDGIRVEDDDVDTSPCGNPIDVKQMFVGNNEEVELLRDLRALEIGDVEQVSSERGLVAVSRRRVRYSGVGRAYLKSEVDLDKTPHRLLIDPETGSDSTWRKMQKMQLKKKTQDPSRVEWNGKKRREERGVLEITGRDGWLDRKGKFYPCEFMGHEREAAKLGSDGRELEISGWIRVSNAEFLSPRFYPGARIPPPTQKQMDAIWSFCEKEGVRFPKELFDDFE